MIKAISVSEVKYDKQYSNNKNNKQITFGWEDGGAYTTHAAWQAQRNYYLKKQLPFYQLFPFFNKKPDIRTFGQTEYLGGEKEMTKVELDKVVAKLEKAEKRIYRKLRNLSR